MLKELLLLSVFIRKALQNSLLEGSPSIPFTILSSVVVKIIAPPFQRCPHPNQNS